MTATTSSSSFRGAPGAPRGVVGRPICKRADRWLRCFLADRIASIGCTAWAMLPALVSAAPVGGFPCSPARWCFYKSASVVRRALMSDHLSEQGINPSRSFRWQKRSRARSNQFAVMPGTFKERISSGVTGREHAYPTSSSIEARSQRDPVGSFLVLRREVRFAGNAGAVVGGGVTLVAGTALAAGAVEVGGLTPTGAAGGGITAATGGGGVTMAACAAREAGAVAGGGVTLAAGTAGLPGAVGGASL